MTKHMKLTSLNDGLEGRGNVFVALCVFCARFAHRAESVDQLFQRSAMCLLFQLRRVACQNRNCVSAVLAQPHQVTHLRVELPGIAVRRQAHDFVLVNPEPKTKVKRKYAVKNAQRV